jgi:hypothetical protein
VVALVDSISAAKTGIVAVDLPNHALPYQLRPAAAGFDSAHKLMPQDATIAGHIAARYFNVLCETAGQEVCVWRLILCEVNMSLHCSADETSWNALRRAQGWGMMQETGAMAARLQPLLQ